MNDDHSQESTPETTGHRGKAPSPWSQKYGEPHRFQRIRRFPEGMSPPRRVRVYRRGNHFILQWWDKAVGHNLAERIDGDLLAALIRARQIDERLLDRGDAGAGQRRLGHAELIERFLEDLKRRADAGNLRPSSVRRYRGALEHLREFVNDPSVRRRYPHPGTINRDFRLAFEACLIAKPVRRRGCGRLRSVKGRAIITDVVRGMLAWAADPERGALLPEYFRNPFLHPSEPRRLAPTDPLAEPDITTAMAVDFIHGCDRWQLRLFAPMLLFGLRAAEPCYLFRDYVQEGWLRVPCNPEIGYHTKGNRDKRFPMPVALAPLWRLLWEDAGPALLYRRRAVMDGREVVPLAKLSLSELAAEFRRRCALLRDASAANTEQRRDQLLREAGALTYDYVEQEFRTLAAALDWPAAATLKDLRHLFATTLGNSAMPEAYRRYLMGHAPPKAAVVAYTHLNRLRDHYEQALRDEWNELIEAISLRVHQLENAASTPLSVSLSTSAGTASKRASKGKFAS